METEKRINDAIVMARRSGAHAPAERIAVAHVHATCAVAEAVSELVRAVTELDGTIRASTGLR